MEINKQNQVIACLQSGKYKVTGSRVYTFRKGKGEWAELKCNLLPTGYSQYTIYNSKRGKKGIEVRVYAHILIYMANNGLYPDGWQIDHLDRNKSNNWPCNLVAKPAKENIMNSDRALGKRDYVSRCIRSQEIAQIKALLANKLSQSAIARQLNLNRLSVRYTIKQIEAGLQLKYE